MGFAGLASMSFLYHGSSKEDDHGGGTDLIPPIRFHLFNTFSFSSPFHQSSSGNATEFGLDDVMSFGRFLDQDPEVLIGP